MADKISKLAFSVILAAPLIWGCQAPWAFGFLSAAVLIAACVHSVLCLCAHRPLIQSADSVWLIYLALLGWLVLTVVVDSFAGAQHERVPAISIRKLPIALAFFGSSLIGAAYLSTVEAVHRAYKGIALLGLVLAISALTQYFGWTWFPEGGFPRGLSRPSGLYTNPNRFAVMLVVCGACALASLVHEIVSERTTRSKITILALALSMAAILYAVALTLSRLTIICTGLVSGILAISWTLIGRRDRQAEDYQDSRILTICRAVAIPALVILAWIVLSVSIGQNDLVGRLSALGAGDPGRAKTMYSALPLLVSGSLFGHGLGSFESLYTAVQPIDVDGRWREVHSDWMQIGIEAGLPCIFLTAALILVWLKSCWHLAGTDTLKASSALRIIPIAGILVVILCSLADFPLRDPATAMLVFFLAGGLCVQWRIPYPKDAKTNAPALGSPRLHASRPLIGVLAALFAFGAIVSTRSAWAYSQTPWLGNIFCPDVTAAQSTQWKRAAAIDPGDPELHFRLAISMHLNPQKKRTELDDARRAVQKAIALQPHDYRFFWIESMIVEQLEEVGEARYLRDTALALAPTNLELNRDTALFELRHSNLNIPGDSRDACISRAVDRYRTVLSANPQLEAEAVDTLAAYGCHPSEIVELWPDTIQRAKFYFDRGLRHEAYAQIRQFERTQTLKTPWFYAIKAALEIRWNDLPSAISFAKQAISNPSDANDQNLDRWLADNIAPNDLDATERLAIELQPLLPKYPILLRTLAARLVREHRWSSADRILAPVANSGSELSALYAELALDMDDYAAASSRARTARNLSLNDSKWGDWYSEFQGKLARVVATKGGSKK